MESELKKLVEASVAFVEFHEKHLKYEQDKTEAFSKAAREKKGTTNG